MENNGENQICTTDPDNHLIVHYDVTNECADWNLLEDGINGAKAALGAETLEGIADRGYGKNDGVLLCLLNGDTPTTHPNKGEKCRLFRFEKIEAEITGDMILSKDKDTQREQETGEMVSYAEMKARGGLETAPVEVKRDPPLQSHFERDIEKDIVICPMGQTLFHAGPGQPNGKKTPLSGGTIGSQRVPNA